MVISSGLVVSTKMTTADRAEDWGSGSEGNSCCIALFRAPLPRFLPATPAAAAFAIAILPGPVLFLPSPEKSFLGPSTAAGLSAREPDTLLGFVLVEEPERFGESSAFASS